MTPFSGIDRWQLNLLKSLIRYVFMDSQEPVFFEMLSRQLKFLGLHQLLYRSIPKTIR
jgi:hypothetical protein